MPANPPHTDPQPIRFDTQSIGIGSAWRVGDSAQRIALDDPSDGGVLAHIARGNAADVDAAVAAAHAALDGPWGALTAAERGRVLGAIGRQVIENIELLARLEALDAGKPLKQARVDALALARYFEFHAGAADKDRLRPRRGRVDARRRAPDAHGARAQVRPGVRQQ